MAICDPCTNGNPPVEYIGQLNCNKKLNTRIAGISQIAFLKCDQVVTSLTDDAQWTAIKGTPGNIVRTPKGFGSLPKPNYTKSKLDGCSPDEVTDTLQTLPFKTLQFDNSTYTDFDFMNDVQGNASNYTLIYIGCDGLLYYSSAWDGTDNPGLDNIAITGWPENPESGLQSVNFEVEFKLNDRFIKGIAISNAVKTAIFG